MKGKTLIVACSLMVVACSPSPKDVAKNFVEAVAHNQYDKAEEYVTDTGKAMIEMARQMGQPLNNGRVPKKIEVVEEKVNGDFAVVKISVDGRIETLNLVKEDGEWKVHMRK